MALAGSLFGAVCPARGGAAGPVLPKVNTGTRSIAPGADGVLILAGAGWHGAAALVIPDNLSLTTLPPPGRVQGRLYSPELNPVENLWQYLRANWRAISVFDRDDAIVEACCAAWNRFANDPDTITPITTRSGAQVN